MKNKANVTTFAALIAITILSIAGVIVSLHLVDLHYKQPGRTVQLIEKYHALAPLKKILPEKYTKPVPGTEEDVTPEKEVQKHYDPWAAYNSNADGTVTPKEQPKKEKESCDVSEEISCSKVDASKYSSIAGIGVSIFGVLGYLAMVLLGIIAIIQRPAKPSIFVMMIYGGAWAGSAFSIYLTYLEAYKIKAYCPWCLVSAGIMLIIFLICTIGFTKGIFRKLTGKAQA